MRTAALIAIALLSLPVHAARTSPFYQPCVESDAIIASVQPQVTPLRLAEAQPQSGLTGLSCHRGQLSQEDLSYVQSVQPSNMEPLVLPVITGVLAHRGQLGDEDISYIESVQPVNAVRLTVSHR